ncbi:hypothetical protein ERO13_A11G048300v2 [Gossypium hirsutum]|uniref:LOB domain-containing protein 39 n=3 Tax=Gossypium TaxID=3633 RepID=A0A1U8L2T4_GOSHI|nr:LOB domain-containing protein 39-like [Gossypium hirsutum]KAG4173270.1 hypothetical protein ERO13_A11G048300v2 [Gossypium hirsutum]PPS09057.1 hypothetical protein GOBAR_AA11578 [Gossypium barbadense]TYJ08173.1 hypothetical protein E1A91_A11G055700v1 [Gossypium mustelinum]
MSCNGCRVLRKGCSDSCILRSCLQWIDNPESQGFATLFVAKFFGRAGLMSFISAVPEPQRPALFQSLLFEACGRTVNPVNGAVGLLWAGNWHVCQAAVETVLRGGTLRPIPELHAPTESNEASEAAGTADMWKLQETATSLNSNCRFSTSRSKVSSHKRRTIGELKKLQPSDLDLCLTPSFKGNRVLDNRRPGTPSMISDESVTTATCTESGLAGQGKLLNLFV